MAHTMDVPRDVADKFSAASIPLGRVAEIEELANLVVMLASPFADNGQRQHD